MIIEVEDKRRDRLLSSEGAPFYLFLRLTDQVFLNN